MPELGGLGGRAGGPREKVMINPPTPRSCPQHLTRAAPVAPHDIIKKNQKNNNRKPKLDADATRPALVATHYERRADCTLEPSSVARGVGVRWWL